jgi:preprotein translocase subunit SecA
VQLIGAIVLHEGRIAEMRTGEGKTLSATLAVYLNALPEESQVHLVTVNDYLARRDASWMGQVYDFLGLSIGVIQNNSSFYFQFGAQSDSESDKKRELNQVDTLDDGIQQSKRSVLDVENLVPCDRKRAYWDNEKGTPIDIVYGVNSEFGFDYLRDNMAQTAEDISQKAGHTVAVIDEVDSILIDEARTPLIISSADQGSSARYKQFSDLVKSLNSNVDYEVNEKIRRVLLTDIGLEKVEKKLGVANLYSSSQNVVLVHHLDKALSAQGLFNREEEYVVYDGEIVIVDQNTGHLMIGRRYSEGLHQAIEAKEGLNVQAESRTSATITFQNYFRLYKKLSGMTGTAATESEELFKIYKLLVVTIPTNRDNVRKDLADRIFKNEHGKFTALVNDVKEIHGKGQPILIGTTSIESNEKVSAYLKKAGIPHSILNAKNHEQEARIISQAGKMGLVTVATNIAGRGIDIKLGGEVPEDPKKLEAWTKENREIKALGGLYVIGTERHESRRIDNQLRGRSGRQGDPGVTRFYISLQDFIIRVFGGDRVKFYDMMPIEDDQSIDNPALNYIINEAQKKIEGQNFDQRKNVTEYDDVTNRQRSVVYTRRSKVLLGEGFDWERESRKAMYNEVYRIISTIPKPKNKTGLDKKAVKQAGVDLKAILPLTDFDADVLEILLRDNKYNHVKLIKIIHNKLIHQLNNRWEIFENRVQYGLARFVFLRAIDVLWKEHLVTISHLQDVVRLRVFSQKDPLVEFKQEGMDLFVDLLQEIDKEIARTIFKVSPDLVPASMLGEVKKKNK